MAHLNSGGRTREAKIPYSSVVSPGERANKPSGERLTSLLVPLVFAEVLSDPFSENEQAHSCLKRFFDQQQSRTFLVLTTVPV